MNAPVDCSVADHVLPMFRTSGPLPLVTAVVMLLNRSGHGITLKLTFTPVCLVKSAIAFLRTCLSWSIVAPWWDAQYVMVCPFSDLPPPLLALPPESSPP